MSKESKPRDRWSQLHSAAHDRPQNFCPSCGYNPSATGQHSPSCAAERKGWCENGCLAYLPVHGHHRADCKHREA